jgi:hypothetical protein
MDHFLAEGSVPLVFGFRRPPLGGKLNQGFHPDRAMRPLGAVLLSSFFDNRLRLFQTLEPMRPETLVPELAIQ